MLFIKKSKAGWVYILIMQSISKYNSTITLCTNQLCKLQWGPDHENTHLKILIYFEQSKVTKFKNYNYDVESLKYRLTWKNTYIHNQTYHHQYLLMRAWLNFFVEWLFQTFYNHYFQKWNLLTSYGVMRNYCSGETNSYLIDESVN